MESFSHMLLPISFMVHKEVNAKLLVPSHCPQRKLLGETSKSNYFLCKQDETYIYNPEIRKLEVV